MQLFMTKQFSVKLNKILDIIQSGAKKKIAGLVEIVYRLVFIVWCLSFIFINMGRKSLNRTYGQVLEIKRQLALSYYKNNRDVVNEKRRKKYQQLKNKTTKII